MNSAAEFWSLVDTSPGPEQCWPWVGALDDKGYGKVWWRDPGVKRGRNAKAHRIALALANRTLIPTAFVLHSCDNPPCCNPAHLRLGSNADNMLDMVERGRQPAQMRRRATCRRGHPLSDSNVIRYRGIRRCRTCQNATRRFRRSRTAADDLARGVLGTPAASRDGRRPLGSPDPTRSGGLGFA